MGRPDPDLDFDAAAQAALDLDRQDLLLLRHLPPVLAELRALGAETAPDRVQLAIGWAQIAICERLGRLARRDLPPDRG